MATLAEELLADFKDDDSDAEDFDVDIDAEEDQDPDTAIDVDITLPQDDKDQIMQDDDEPQISESLTLQAADDEVDARTKIQNDSFLTFHNIKSVADLMKTLKPLLAKVNLYKPISDKQRIGTTEDDPEYKLLLDANYHASLIDNEVVLINKFIKDHYKTRFPELETVVWNPLDYAKTVAILGNFDADSFASAVASSNNIVGQPLNAVLDRRLLITIQLGVIGTAGRKMTESGIETVKSACEMTLELERAKQILTSYVESRMVFFAPNLTRLISSKTAALMVNTAGGLTALAKIPACNIAAMGAKKQSHAGWATNTGGPKQGYLYYSPLLEDIPDNLKTQALRIVSAKLILAARCDRVQTTPDGSTGERLKRDCLDRLEKLVAPPPNNGPRALPAPDDKPSRKRGGKRARRAKEQYAMTDLQKAQNRMAFGKEEAEVGFGDETVGLGMIGSAGSEGQIRATKIDQRTKARLSKNNPGWGFETVNHTTGGLTSSLRGLGQGAGSASVLQSHGLRSSINAGAGTASVIKFSATEGLELIDPRRKKAIERKREADQDGWFKSGTFTQLGGSSSVIASSSGNTRPDTAGFKVPALPVKKKVKKDPNKQSE